MGSKAQELLEKLVVVDGHNHMMMEVARRRAAEEKAVFESYHKPLFRKAGLNVVLTQMGGDNSSLADFTDLLLCGTIATLDMVYQELDEGKDDIMICKSYEDITTSIQEGKLGLLLTMEGARPLEGKPHDQTLAILRNFYRQGVRGIQLVDNGRNRLCDGKGEARTQGGLTNFGVSVVEEMNRLGMIIDLAHIADRGFWDVIEISKDPVIDSHSNCFSINNHPRNLTDEQIRAIAEKKGVIGLTANSPMTSEDSDNSTIDDLIMHLNHIIDLVGDDFVGLGPDLIESHNCLITHGWLEGVFYSSEQMHYVNGFTGPENIPDFFEQFTEAMISNGYKEETIGKVLGGNWLRLYKAVLK